MLIRDFRNPCPGRDGIFLFTSEHQLRQLVFRTPQDFSYGVNTLALGTLKYKVRVLARTLAYRFSAPKKQISRLLGIASDVLDSAL